MTEENKNEISTEMEINSEATKVELSEEEMDEINGGGVDMSVLLNGTRRGKPSNLRRLKPIDMSNVAVIKVNATYMIRGKPVTKEEYIAYKNSNSANKNAKN